MATIKLTKTAVENLPVDAADVFHWDTELAGFGIKVTPQGKRVYVLQYRVGGRGARSRRLKIADHGVYTVEQARKQAVIWKGEIAKGLDPSEERRKLRSDLKLSALADLFLTEGRATRKDSTQATHTSNIDRHIKPLFV